MLLTDSVRRRGGCQDVLAVVLGQADDSAARDVVATLGAAVPSVPVGWWSIEQFVDAAGRRPALAAWAEAVGGRYVLAEDG